MFHLLCVAKRRARALAGCGGIRRRSGLLRALAAFAVVAALAPAARAQVPCPYNVDFIFPLPQQACFTELAALPKNYKIAEAADNAGKALELIHRLFDARLYLNEGDVLPGPMLEVAFLKKDFDYKNRDRQEAYELEISKTDGGVRVEMRAETEAGFYYAYQTFRQLLSGGRDDGTLPLGAVLDFPRFSIRGVIEGGYKVWDNTQRLDIVKSLGPDKMNFFMYAPKEGEFFRRQWRRPYTQAMLDQFQELIDACNESYVTFAYALSPALSMEYGSDEEFETLLAKYMQIADLGAANFAIFFDDVLPALHASRDRERFANVAEAEVYVTNKLYSRLKEVVPGARLVMVPNQYWGTRASIYLKTIADTLAPGIDIGWTGMEIVSDSITKEDALAFAKSWGRPPGIGDNWSPFGPMYNRAPDLWEATDSFINNPYAFVEPHNAQLSKIVDSTLADYTWNPEAYLPERSMRMATRKLAGGDPAAGEVLLKVIEATQRRRGGAAYTSSLSTALDLAKETKDPVVFINIMTKFENDVKKLLDADAILADSGMEAMLYKQLHGHIVRATSIFRDANAALSQYFASEGSDENRKGLIDALEKLGF